MGRQKHQEGTLQITGKDQHWTGYFYTYDHAGERHRRSTNLGPSKGVPKWKAQEKLRVVIERETAQPVLTSGEDTLEWYWRQRYAPFQKWSKETRRVVEGTFERHVLRKIGRTKLKDLEKYQLQLLLQGCIGYSQTVLNKIRTYLWIVLEQALDDGLIAKNPMKKVRASSTLKPTDRFLTIEELDRLLAELEPRDRLVCRIACVMGLRPGELFALTWADYDQMGHMRVEKSWVRGEIKETKTKGSTATIWVPSTIVQGLSEWREATTSGSPYIFPTRRGRPMGTLYFLRRVKAAAIRAGIMQARPKGLPKGQVWGTKDVTVNFQAMRRTCATLTVGDIKAVQAIMRHSNATTTLKYYRKAIPEDVKAAQEALDARIAFGAMSDAAPASPLTM